MSEISVRLVNKQKRRPWRTKALCVAITLAASTLSIAAGADSGVADFGHSDEPMFSIGGFGTLGAVHSSEDKADFAGNFLHLDGAGYTREWHLGVDSKLGLQVDAQLSDRLSVVVQGVSQYRYDGTYKPRLEWANVKYDVTPELSVRAGRTVLATFMVSDTRLVGYANLWIRPPKEMYELVQVTNLDGIDASYRLHLGQATSQLQVTYGQTDLRRPDQGTVNVRNGLQVSNTIGYGPTTLRASYTSARLSLHTPGLDEFFGAWTQFGNTMLAVPGLEPVGAQALAIVDKYRFENVPFSSVALGASYDPGDWLVMAEWTKTNASAFLSDATAWYVTGGLRVGSYSPYVTFARLETKGFAEGGLPAAALPSPLDEAAAQLNAGLAYLLNVNSPVQETVSVGVRWDFMRNTALKVQYDHVDLGEGSVGWLRNAQPGFQPGGTANVYSVAVDFVF